MKTNSETEATLDQEHRHRPTFGSGSHAADFAERVRVNQRKLSSQLRCNYDFIVCGSGSSVSVVARHLAENPDVLP